MRYWLGALIFMVAVFGVLWLLDDGEFTRADCIGATGDRYEKCESLGFR